MKPPLKWGPWGKAPSLESVRGYYSLKRCQGLRVSHLSVVSLRVCHERINIYKQTLPKLVWGFAPRPPYLN